MSASDSNRELQLSVKLFIRPVEVDLNILEHAELARRFRQTLSIYQQHRDLISIGAYQKGSDPRIDAAIDLWPAMQKFLVQPIEERVGQRDAVQALAQLFASGPPPAARKAGA